MSAKPTPLEIQDLCWENQVSLEENPSSKNVETHQVNGLLCMYFCMNSGYLVHISLHSNFLFRGKITYLSLSVCWTKFKWNIAWCVCQGATCIICAFSLRKQKVRLYPNLLGRTGHPYSLLSASLTNILQQPFIILLSLGCNGSHHCRLVNKRSLQ